MTKILLVHHTAYHFETLVSFYDTLSPHYDVSVWSNSLHRFERLEFLRLMGAQIFEVGQEFDLSVVITYDEPLTEKNCGTTLLAAITSKPVVKVLHRYYGTSGADEIHLFPKALNAFIPISSGYRAGFLERDTDHINKFLIQGNVEARRNYDIIPLVAPAGSDIVINIVGQFVSEHKINHEGVVFSHNLSELLYRKLCHQNHFICPMLDPIKYKQYFTDRFSSSVQAGYSFDLPFLAHKQLFDLYPISGLAYDDVQSFSDCWQQAAHMGKEDYMHMLHDLAVKRAAVGISNITSFRKVLAALEDRKV